MNAVLPPPAPTGPLSTPEPSPTRAPRDAPSHDAGGGGGGGGDDDDSGTGTAGGASAKASPAKRDPVFWTELEIRRLGNLIAASIEARAFVGTSPAAAAERAQMRVYLDAMKRKAFRVLERAERFAHSPEHEWPGLDPTVADPVALADEYIKVVQDYLAVLAAEEDAAAAAEAEAAAEAAAAGADADTPAAPSADARPDDGETPIDPDSDAQQPVAAARGSDDAASAAPGDGAEKPGADLDDWVAADDEAYREALKRERDALETGRKERAERAELLEDEGLRRRRGGDGEGDDGVQGKLSAVDEELMARHQPIQDDLTANLVDLVGQLKESVADNRDKLATDRGVLDTAESAVEANLAAIKRQRDNLQKFTQTSSTSWWLILAGACVIFVVFLVVFVLLKIPL